MSQTAAYTRTYKKLVRRNRVVGLLRVLVPIAGLLVLLALGAQLYLSSIGGRFEVGRITVTPEAVLVEAPEYVGVLPDGSSYRVSSQGASSNNDRRDLVNLEQASVVLKRVDGVQFEAQTNDAVLDTINELTTAEGLTAVSDSTGTVGTLMNSVFDWRKQVLTADGPVAIDYADGTKIRAEGLVYDAENVLWTFKRSVVTMPSTPGEGTSTPEEGDTL